MPEIALDTEAIGAALRARLAADPRITLHLGSCIERVEPAGSEIRLHTRRSGETESLSYDQVINATWADLLRIDATAGVPSPKDASFRWRYIVRIRAPHGARGLPTCSIVLGPFGDLVEYGRGDLFLSWYPAGRQAMVASVSPPAHWSQGPLAEDATGVAPRTFAALRSLVPALGAVTEGAVETAEVQAGIIYARGTSDIDDRGSGYHRRDRIGPHSYGRYHSVDTGKYTTAPLFARRLAEAIAGQR
jgi:2-polyprenyl-6-methoxyphenol hydroxylase-like FAD-dependent oxidoreductase